MEITPQKYPLRFYSVGPFQYEYPRGNNYLCRVFEYKFSEAQYYFDLETMINKVYQGFPPYELVRTSRSLFSLYNHCKNSPEMADDAWMIICTSGLRFREEERELMERVIALLEEEELLLTQRSLLAQKEYQKIKNSAQVDINYADKEAGFVEEHYIQKARQAMDALAYHRPEMLVLSGYKNSPLYPQAHSQEEESNLEWLKKEVEILENRLATWKKEQESYLQDFSTYFLNFMEELPSLPLYQESDELRRVKEIARAEKEAENAQAKEKLEAEVEANLEEKEASEEKQDKTNKQAKISTSTIANLKGEGNQQSSYKKESKTSNTENGSDVTSKASLMAELEAKAGFKVSNLVNANILHSNDELTCSVDSNAYSIFVSNPNISAELKKAHPYATQSYLASLAAKEARANSQDPSYSYYSEEEEKQIREKFDALTRSIFFPALENMDLVYDFRNVNSNVIMVRKRTLDAFSLNKAPYTYWIMHDIKQYMNLEKVLFLRRPLVLEDKLYGVTEEDKGLSYEEIVYNLIESHDTLAMKRAAYYQRGKTLPRGRVAQLFKEGQLNRFSSLDIAEEKEEREEVGKFTAFVDEEEETSSENN